MPASLERTPAGYRHVWLELLKHLYVEVLKQLFLAGLEGTPGFLLSLDLAQVVLYCRKGPVALVEYFDSLNDLMQGVTGPAVCHHCLEFLYQIAVFNVSPVVMRFGLV